MMTFWGAKQILTKENSPIFKKPFFLRVKIPLQLEESNMAKSFEAAGDTVEGAGKSITVVQLAARTAFNFSLNELLGTISFMQLIVYLPLFETKFPSSAMIIYEKIIGIVSFDLLNTDDWYPFLF